MTNPDNKVSVRNIDKDLWTEARIYATRNNQSLGSVINAALKNFLAEGKANV